MPKAEVHPNAENATLEELKVAMEAAPNKRSYLRLMTIRSLLLGIDRETLCKITLRTDRMVRLWIELFNRGGIDALITRGRGGRRRKVKLERVRDLLVPVLENPEQAGQVHWTGVKIHGYLKEQLAMELGYSTAVRWLHELNFHLRVPRPWPERQNEEERKQFQAELTALVDDPKVELWYSDECGVEGDPRPRRRWVQPGKRRTVPYLGDHIRQNVIGAVSHQSGQLFSLIVDNASWHRAARVNWHHFEPKFLPGYSPDFNPIERLWLRLKADWFWDFFAATPDQLTDRLCLALRSFIADSSKTASICSIRK